MARKKKSTPGLNGAGMSDISFLLLCFFLMVSSIDSSKGLQRRLPPMPDENQKSTDIKVNRRNTMQVLVNGADQLSVNGVLRDVSELRAEVKDFITNPSNDPNKSEKKSKTLKNGESVPVSEAVISLQNVRATSYDMYMKVQNEIVAAYNELRDQESKARFGKKFDDLKESQQDIIKDIYPQKISEAEPKDITKKK